MCNACGETKPYSEFNRNSETADGYRYTCKLCRKNHVPTNPEFTKVTRKQQDKTVRVPYGSNASELRRFTKYGITEQQFKSMLSSQKGCCAICQKTLGAKFCIDHDHATGRVRGLLCYPCNSGIGLLNDDPVLLTAALAYLT